MSSAAWGILEEVKAVGALRKKVVSKLIHECIRRDIKVPLYGIKSLTFIVQLMQKFGGRFTT